ALGRVAGHLVPASRRTTIEKQLPIRPLLLRRPFLQAESTQTCVDCVPVSVCSVPLPRARLRVGSDTRQRAARGRRSATVARSVAPRPGGAGEWLRDLRRANEGAAPRALPGVARGRDGFARLRAEGTRGRNDF